jgi:hypothetical protein
MFEKEGLQLQVRQPERIENTLVLSWKHLFDHSN